MTDAARDLLDYIDASPTPYHAVAESARRLEAAGYERAHEGELWTLSPGDRRYVSRAGGSLIAFRVGAESPAEGGFRVVGAHTDSPNLRLRPKPEIDACGYRQLAVETYGGLLLHTWLDRDLSIAGRVVLRGGPREGALIDFGRPLLRIPNLAIHLNREIRDEGLKLNPQTHSLPILGLEDAPPLPELLEAELTKQGVSHASADRIQSWDLMLYDTQPSALAGVNEEFIHAPRLDNLASCHAALAGLIESDPGNGAATSMIVLYDHEEVGSRSAQGASGTFLVDTLERCVGAFKGGEPQGLARARARSVLISADMAHAVHPNYSDKHEPGHRPVIGRGPVIKTNVDQAYATDAATAGLFTTLCEDAGVKPQQFTSRNDMPCGSTIGPISAARSGIPTVDVGNPMLSMHSCREMAGAADVAPMIQVFRGLFEQP